MSLRLSLVYRLYIMNYGDESVTISPDVKHDISVDVISISEHTPKFYKIVPSDAFDYGDPRFDFVRRPRMFLHGFSQMLARD